MSESTESIQPVAPTPNRGNSPVRDAITIGIFVALYIVLFFICGTTMGVIPLITVLLLVIFGVFGGPVFVILLGKVQRTGISLIVGPIIGLMMIPMAPGGVMCYMTTAGGVVAEVTHWLMGHKSFASMTAACTAFVTFFALGKYIPFVWMKDVYLEFYANNPTLNAAEVGMDTLNPATMAAYCLPAIVACVAGRFRGRVLTRR